MKSKHKELQEVAIRWLYATGCSVFAKEVPTMNGNADALGIKTLHGKDDIYYIEAKASRSDLICKKQKRIYANAIGVEDAWCWMHDPKMYRSMFEGDDRSKGWEDCDQCKKAKEGRGDTGIDFYYIIVAHGVKVEKALYPAFGVLDEDGNVLRKAKRMTRNERTNRDLIVAVAHVLVYKVFGKMYAVSTPEQ